MRVALVAESFFPAVDGTTTTVKAVADHLIDQGHDVLLVAPAPGLTRYRGSRVVRIHSLDATGAQVRAALEAFEPDLVHVTSPVTAGNKALKHARRLGVRTLAVQQTPVSHLGEDRWAAKLVERADRVLVTAGWMQERLADLGIGAALWSPGVDTTAFGPQLRDAWLHARWARARSAAGPLVVVGYVGSLHKRHGVRWLAELSGMPGTRLVVIGAGPQRAWLEARLPSAKFTGALETGDLTRALPSLDVLVHPGHEETCCHAPREAAASGVPVVAPRSGGAPDVVRSLETGLLYEPDDPRGLQRAVAAVVADPQRHLLGDRARELSLARTWRDAAAELVAVHYPDHHSRRPDAA